MTINDEIEFHFTAPFEEIVNEVFMTNFMEMVAQSLRFFNEMNPNFVHIGLTRTAAGIAQIGNYTHSGDTIALSINPLYVSYYVIGHELTHFAQQITAIPSGEKACDIFTIARSELFMDVPPYYLNVPKREWKNKKRQVRKLCIQAIEYRKTKRNYIQWLENKLREL